MGLLKAQNFLQALALFLSIFLLITPVKAETLVIPGSGNPEFVLGELARMFNSQQKQHQVFVPTTTGTAGALRDVAEGVATIGRVGRPLSEAERKLGLSYLPLGSDPIVFVGGAGVSVRNISRTGVVDIYTGKLTNWQQLGGKPAAIRAIGREKTDASFRAILRDIKAFGDLRYGDSVKVVHLDSQLLELLDRFPSSFGFLNRSALAAAKTKLVILTLDSIAPDSNAPERYPLWTEVGLVFKAEALTEAGRAFLKFVRSPAAIQLLRSHGLVPATPIP